MCLIQKLSLKLILLTLLQDSTFHFEDVAATSELTDLCYFNCIPGKRLKFSSQSFKRLFFREHF